ncbi:hypothetical protein RB195_011054 [Necator americanus]|uniref:Ig-like domain-containing protein n=1 Tax=Necator americanus TaxID=51031 RepID=A0ABR1D0S7_NECAM
MHFDRLRYLPHYPTLIARSRYRIGTSGPTVLVRRPCACAACACACVPVLAVPGVSLSIDIQKGERLGANCELNDKSHAVSCDFQWAHKWETAIVLFTRRAQRRSEKQARPACVRYVVG